MMVLTGRTALVHGGGGAVGGAVARAFAAAGARVHLAGRSRARLEAVADEIGDAAVVADVDALDGRAVADHADAVAAAEGGIDIALNAVSFPFVHDRAFAEVSVEEVLHPIERHLRTNLVTAKAVAPHMAARGAGTILTLSAAASRIGTPGSLGYGTACAAIETLTQRLAVELGPSGVRVACLRSHLIADGPAHGSPTGELFARRAAAAGVDVAQLPADVTLLGRLPTLAQVGAAAVFVASDGAAAITGAVLDLTCGSAVRTATGSVVGVLD
ncbi:SDR family NAD(P)-dependent oxidoreductase [Pseudonocardia kunmingensis]|uniref:Enoyl-ACP reductase-like protein n=1 Tax=Pseudonocardia kunmingensis TaxID=630975 RepID=A0A543DZ59_9PSEU|nr:SDR family oxidoreductase [Pseudonocardia kunmingensis]TQM14630.1 enoyl-ACP reductase-like protein [Pseudonocardia kunmingensis]